MLVDVDGTLFGQGGNDYVTRIAGGGDSGWQTVTLDLGSLSPGNHTLTLGGYNNRKTTTSEATEIRFDDVDLTLDYTSTVNDTFAVDPAFVDLSIASSLVDTDGSESLSIVIGGVPTGATLSAGTDNGDGTWTLADTDLPGLTLFPPTNYTGTFQLTVTATSTDGSDTASIAETIDVTVADVNSPPYDMDLSNNTVIVTDGVGTSVGVITTSDPDAGDTHTYTLLDDANGRFTIDPNTGEITVNQALGDMGPTSGLVKQWALNDGSGTTASESVGAPEGTLVNMDPSDWVPGQTLGGLDFDGVDDYVDTNADIGQTLGGTSTLTFWINTTQTGSATNWDSPAVTGNEEAGGTNDIQWGWLDDSGHINISVGNTQGARSANPINDGQWHHVAISPRRHHRRDAGLCRRHIRRHGDQPHRPHHDPLLRYRTAVRYRRHAQLSRRDAG